MGIVMTAPGINQTLPSVVARETELLLVKNFNVVF